MGWSVTAPLRRAAGFTATRSAETQGGFFMDPAKRHLVAERLPKYQSIQFPGI